jgi:hypothetical protein
MTDFVEKLEVTLRSRRRGRAGFEANACEQGLEIEAASARMKGRGSMKGLEEKEEARKGAPDV